MLRRPVKKTKSLPGDGEEVQVLPGDGASLPGDGTSGGATVHSLETEGDGGVALETTGGDGPAAVAPVGEPELEPTDGEPRETPVMGLRGGNGVVPSETVEELGENMAGSSGDSGDSGERP